MKGQEFVTGAPSVRAFEDTTMEVERLYDQAGALNSRLNNALNRAYGEGGGEKGDTGVGSLPTGTIPRLNGAVARLRDELLSLASNIDRLEAII